MRLLNPWYSALFILTPVEAFTVQDRNKSPSTVLRVAATATSAEHLISKARQVKDKFGVFLTDKDAKQEIEDLVEQVEKEGRDASMTPADILGDWTLLCTLSQQQESSFSQLVSPSTSPVSNIRSSIAERSNRFVTVKQRIRSSTGDGVVDRVDNVIEYGVPDQLGNLFPPSLLPEALSNLAIFNPLQVAKSKVILCHDAKMLETYGKASLFTTQIVFKSIVLNVAGESTFLDPSGKDVVGLNLPVVGEFSLGGSGTFETTYLDTTIRVSHGKVGPRDQLRVFVRDSPLFGQEDYGPDNMSEPLPTEDTMSATPDTTQAENVADNENEDLDEYDENDLIPSD